MHNPLNYILLLFTASVLTGCGGSNTSDSNTESQTITQNDTTPPVLTILGENPITIEGGGKYEDSGATALDSEDGELAVTTANNVSADKVGEYTVEYIATDSSGNTAQVIRTVIVEDTTAPRIEILGDNPATVEGGSEYNDSGALAKDKVDGDLTVIMIDKVSMMKVGEYTAEYTATDRSGNTASAIRTVKVQDTTAPIITLDGGSDVVINYGSAYQDLGAAAHDALDGAVTLTVTHSVDSDTIGTYSAEYVAIDTAGNKATAVRTVVVQDIALESIIEDTNLLACLKENGLVNASEVIEINCNAKQITSAKGIEFLKNLTKLSLNNGLSETATVSRVGREQPATFTHSNISSTLIQEEQVASPVLANIDLSQNINLEWLDLGNNGLTELDISQNTNLKFLSVGSNQLTHLSLDNNSSLETLTLTNNKLMSIELSNNVNLHSLDLGRNQLSVLETSNNTALQSLSLNNNLLTELDMRDNPNLQLLDLGSNQLVNIDVSHNVKLKELKVNANLLTEVELSNNTNLESLNLGENKLTSLDVSNNVKLKALELESNPIAVLDVSKNVNLIKLKVNDKVECSGEQCSVVVVQDTTPPSITILGSNPTRISVGEVYQDAGATAADAIDGAIQVAINNTVNVDVAGNYTVEYTATDSAGNTVTASRAVVVQNVAPPIIKDSTPPSITILGDNPVTINYGAVYQDAGASVTDTVDKLVALVTNNTVNPDIVGTYTVNYTATDLAGNTAAVSRTVIVQDLALSSIIEDENLLNCLQDAGFKNASEVLNIACWGKSISSAKGIEFLTGLTTLDLNGNQLSSIDVSKNTNLIRIDIESNQLNSIDVTQNNKLVTLNLQDNQLAHIDVSKNANIETLGLKNNKLTVLDISNNVVLQYLGVSRNQITDIDVSNNNSLTTLILNDTVKCTGDKCSIVTAEADSWPPVITILGDNPTTISYGAAYQDAGATVRDDVDGSVSIVTTSNVNSDIVGQYYSVEYSATDAAGNNKLVQRQVIVQDILLDSIIEDANLLSCLKGAGYKTASEVVSIECAGKGVTSAKGIEFLKGLTSLDLKYNPLSSIDLSQNSKLVTLTLSDTVACTGDKCAIATLVADTVPPVITVLGEQTSTISYGSVYQDAGATAADVVDGAVMVSTINNVNPDVVGVYTVEYMATDIAGNTASATRTVTVQDIALSSIIADANLLSCLQSAGFTNASEVNEINCTDKGISSTTGIEYLKGLKTLTIEHVGAVSTTNLLSSIDVSKNINLQGLSLSGNKLTEIDVSANTALQMLKLSNNQLVNINLSSNSELSVLALNNNKLAAVDLRNNIYLESIEISENQLTEIDLSKNSIVDWLKLEGNRLPQIDLSNNLRLSTLNLNSNIIERIDLSNNTDLKNLSLQNCGLSEVDIRLNVNLESVNLSLNSIQALDITNNASLKSLSLVLTNISELDLRNNLKLEALNVDADLNSLDVSSNINLKHLRAHANQFQHIDLTNNIHLEHIDFTGSQLTTIDVSNNVNVKTLLLPRSQLTHIDVTYNTGLNELIFDDTVICTGDKCSIASLNDITPPVITVAGGEQFTINYGSDYQDMGATAVDAVDGVVSVKTTNNVNSGVIGQYTVEYSATDLAGNTANAIRTVTVQDISLSSIIDDNNLLSCLHNAGLVNASEVVEVSCISKSISSATGIESLIGLKKLDLSSDFAGGSSLEKNLLTSIDLSKNTSLQELRLDFNLLTDIDVSNNTQLEVLYVSGTSNSNILTSIDISKNINLKTLGLSGNPLTSIDVSNNNYLTFLNLDDSVVCAGSKCSIRQ
ncbi:immunoglobulin-like domain-containing protein [Pseudoalteromonas citrea]|nr:immunoglobulin-like domain-containing protein [Pseudoalteromonas citrea]